MSEWEAVLRTLAALVAGGAIGLERSYRAGIWSTRHDRVCAPERSVLAHPEVVSRSGIRRVGIDPAKGPDRGRARRRRYGGNVSSSPFR